jgi:hypothetical protein
MPTPSPAASAPLAYTIDDFAIASGTGRTKVYAAIRAGHLRARKYGKRTLILAEDARAFLNSLPEMKIA